MKLSDKYIKTINLQQRHFVAYVEKKLTFLPSILAIYWIWTKNIQTISIKKLTTKCSAVRHNNSHSNLLFYFWLREHCTSRKTPITEVTETGIILGEDVKKNLLKIWMIMLLLGEFKQSMERCKPFHINFTAYMDMCSSICAL